MPNPSKNLADLFDFGSPSELEQEPNPVIDDLINQSTPEAIQDIMDYLDYDYETE